MAVITRYVIVRNGVELDKVFEDKKLAEAYDKMLDAAEALAAFIKQGDLKIDINPGTVDEIAVYLAKNGPEVTRILKGVKPVTPRVPAPGPSRDAAEPAAETKAPAKKSGTKSKQK